MALIYGEFRCQRSFFSEDDIGSLVEHPDVERVWDAVDHMIRQVAGLCLGGLVIT